MTENVLFIGLRAQYSTFLFMTFAPVMYNSVSPKKHLTRFLT